MANADDMAWFKRNFHGPMARAVRGTPITVDFLTALACQETGEVWPLLRRKLTDVDRVLALCVGDTIDRRSAFPASRAELLAAPRGQEMFAMARQALVDMARFIKGYEAVARQPAKYCHAFGVFQVDIQHFRKDPDYFLDRTWASFEGTLGRAMDVLRFALKKRGFEGCTALSDLELATVGIVYNTGGFRASAGLNQGFRPPGGKFYGQALFDLIRLAHTVPDPGAAGPLLAVPPAGEALVEPPVPVGAGGTPMKVAVSEGMLRVRSAPEISDPPQKNVVAHLPDGHPVRAHSGPLKGFFGIETSLKGALIRGFASARFLVADAPDAPIELTRPAPTPPAAGIVAVHMPAKAGLVTRRRDPATARSLDEKNAPGRTGTTPDELRRELAAIVAWLGVDNPQLLRYRPTRTATFCNIYAHDFCRLAGVYLPRVWWSSPALLRLAAGAQVRPLLGDTIVEMRANDLFRWLRDFGADFGWRQAGTPTELQAEVNQGAVGAIVARRKEEGRSGHIAMVVSEAAARPARRDRGGAVTAPQQSQAGADNFRYGTGRANWWNGEQFAESAFWLHA